MRRWIGLRLIIALAYIAHGGAADIAMNVLWSDRSPISCPPKVQSMDVGYFALTQTVNHSIGGF